MLKTVLVVVGLLVAIGGALYPVWRGVDAREAIRGLEMNIYRERSLIAYRPANKEQGEENIAGWQREIEAKQTESNLWFAVAAGPVVVGIGIIGVALVSPWSRKRKVPAAEPVPAGNEAPAAEPAPARNPEAPGL
jgi:hypothetical protein